MFSRISNSNGLLLVYFVFDLLFQDFCDAGTLSIQPTPVGNFLSSEHHRYNLNLEREPAAQLMSTCQASKTRLCCTPPRPPPSRLLQKIHCKPRFVLPVMNETAFHSSNYPTGFLSRAPAVSRKCSTKLVIQRSTVVHSTSVPVLRKVRLPYEL